MGLSGTFSLCNLDNFIILEVSDLQKNGVDYKVLGMEPFSWRSKVFNFLSNDRAGS